METSQNARSFKPRACQKCGGDAFFDAGEALEWRCLQCGKSLTPLPQGQPAEEPGEAVIVRRSGWDRAVSVVQGNHVPRRTRNRY